MNWLEAFWAPWIPGWLDETHLSGVIKGYMDGNYIRRNERAGYSHMLWLYGHISTSSTPRKGVKYCVCAGTRPMKCQQFSWRPRMPLHHPDLQKLTYITMYHPRRRHHSPLHPVLHHHPFCHPSTHRSSDS
jgi:hypothetical protein